MRLSATDRIIREAQQHESAAVEAEDERPDTEKVTGAPLLSLGFPSPRMPTPVGGGVDVTFDDDDGGADEEGETQVDAKRSAAALDKMRALQEGSLTPPPALVRPSGRYRGLLPPGAPGGRATIGLVGTPASSAPEVSPQTTLMYGAVATRIAPAPAAPRPLPSFEQPPWQPSAPDQPRSSPRRQFDGVPIPSPALGAPATPSRRVSVGRRAGSAVAAAVAVTVLVGAWSAREVAHVRAVDARPAEVGAPLVRPALTSGSGRSPAPPAAGTVVALETPPSAEPVPAATAKVASPAPTVELVPLLASAVAPPVAPTPQAGGEPSVSLSPPAPKHAQAATKSPRALKTRSAKKKAFAAKRTVRTARPTRAVIGGGGAPGRPPDSRHHADPDDTLPISD